MLERIDTEKIYFNPGDVVRIKHDLDYNPKMLVKEKATKLIKDDKHFQGIKCIWFTSNGTYQEQVFSTKDLEMISSPYTTEIKTKITYRETSFYGDSLLEEK